MSKPNAFLPRTESFKSCTGATHSFRISQGPQSIEEGYVITASEITKENEGYEFSAWSPSLGDALGKLRGKIKRGLSKKYLIGSPEKDLCMTHDQLSGMISYNGVVVDGRLVEWEAFISLLTVSEGFQLDLSITDPTG